MTVVDGAADIAGDGNSDADIDGARTPADRAWWRWHVSAALLLPPALYLTLMPDSYSVVPNGLDPYFYTGYAMNFDDIMREVGDGYYFVSRWTVYMPSRASMALFGTIAGRLVLRWLVASAMLVAVWHFGRQWRWSRTTALVVGVVLLSNPIFARAFMTDYVEWVVVGLGVIGAALCFEPTLTAARAGLIGALFAAVVVANPMALTVVGVPAAIALGYLHRTDGRAFARNATCMSAGGLVVLGGGWLLFRAQYGISNVYAPTIDFVQRNTDYSDPLKSPRLDWLGAFTWIYIPAVVLAAIWSISPLRRRFHRDTAMRALMWGLAIQYAWQWVDQFVRDGNGLEISYYWSFIYPMLAITIAAVLGTVEWTRSTAIAFIGVWWIVIVLARTTDIRLPNGWFFAAMVLAVLAVLHLDAERRHTSAVCALMVVTLVAEVGAPAYDPLPYHWYNMDPRYDEAFYEVDGLDRKRLDATIWLADELDALPSDSGMYFFGVDEAYAIAGIYGAHVTGRSVPWTPSWPLSRPDVAEVDAGTIPIIAVFGPPDAVDEIRGLVTHEGDRGSVILDRDAAGLGYSLTVIELPIPAYEPSTWPARALGGETGQVVGSARLAGRSDPAGFLVTGPSVYLTDGALTA